jgi:hypothetical protein
VRPRMNVRVTTPLAAALAGAAALVWLTAAPAGAVTGNEQITAPVPVSTGQEIGTTSYVWPEATSSSTDGVNPNTPDSNLVTISGTGYSPSTTVFFELCDGLPQTAAGWSFAKDCDPTEDSAIVNTSGSFTDSNDPNIPIVRGESDADIFNCLATDDNPNSTVTADGSNDPIDPSKPSWGESTVGTAGGGTAPCQLRISYSENTSQPASDKYFTGIVSPTAPSITPESPLPILLPAGAALVLAGAGGVIYLKRRRSAAAA